MTISHDIISELALYDDVSEHTLPPLYEVIDPDALEQLLCHTNQQDGTDLLVRFSYLDYRITIRPPREITIEKSASWTD